MTEKYDVAVIGAGVGGLCAGAMLAKEGKKVSVIESIAGLGGRAGSIPIKGIYTEFGFHGIVNNGFLIKILEHLDIEIPMIPLLPNFVVYSEGKYYSAPSKIEDYKDFEYISAENRDELITILEEIKNTPFEETEKYDFQPWDDWIRARTDKEELYDYLIILANIPLTEDRGSWISAGEALRAVAIALIEGEWSVYPRDGAMIVVHEALAKYIEDRGGKVFLKTAVQEIKTPKNGKKVTGVLCTNKDGVLDIDAGIVLFNPPVWEVLDYVEPEHFPKWFVERLRYLDAHHSEAATQSFGITVVSKKSINDYNTAVLLTAKDSATRLGGQMRWLSQPTNWTPGLSEGLHLFQYGPICDRGMVEFLRERPSFYQRALDALWEEILAMNPDLTEEDVVFKGNGVIRRNDFTMKFPGNTWMLRVDVKAPHIQGLYFVGDTVRGWGVAMDSAACSALLAVEAITGKSIGIDYHLGM
jgi:Phytoene dehydrogenase and related proteins